MQIVAKVTISNSNFEDWSAFFDSYKDVVNLYLTKLSRKLMTMRQESVLKSPIWKA